MSLLTVFRAACSLEARALVITAMCCLWCPEAWALADNDLLDFGGSAGESSDSKGDSLGDLDDPLEGAPPPPKPGDVMDDDPLDDPKEPAPKAPEPDKKSAEPTVDPRSLDRIKAVPRKRILKKGRVEITPFFSASMNDAYFQHLATGGTIVFYPHDSFGIGIGADYMFAHLSTPNVALVRETRSSVLAEFEHPTLFAHLDLYWIPLYGKVSLFDSSILHFDMYAVAGGGIATSFGEEMPPAFNIGLGQRMIFTDWLAFRVELRDHMYVGTQRVNGLPRSSIQHFLMLQAGISIFLPPSFEYSIR